MEPSPIIKQPPPQPTENDDVMSPGKSRVVMKKDLSAIPEEFDDHTAPKKKEVLSPMDIIMEKL